MTSSPDYPLIAPSLLGANFLEVRQAVSQVEASGAPWLHLDVMDGHFVPNLSFGPKMIADIRAATSLVLDVHLMIEHPEASLDQYLAAGADWVTFHHEAVIHQHRFCELVHAAGRKVGLSIVPSTPLAVLTEILPFVDLVLVMSVNPGFGGQKLIPAALAKLAALVQYRQEHQLAFLTSIDGGVNLQTAEAVAQGRPDVIVAGSAFFSAPDQRQFTDSLKAVMMSFRKPG